MSLCGFSCIRDTLPQFTSQGRGAVEFCVETAPFSQELAPTPEPQTKFLTPGVGMEPWFSVLMLIALHSSH